MERGFVKLWRSIDQNELLENDNTAYVVFTKLLTRVNRHNGSYTTGRKKLAYVCNINPNTLYSALKRLEASTMIQQQSNKVSTTITICNWWKYQQDDNKPSSERHRSVNTKQEKKEKENKKEIKKEKSLAKISELDLVHETLLDYWGGLIGRKLTSNKTSKDSLRKLLVNHKTDEIEEAIRGAVYFRSVPYRPKVMSFSSMYEKWDSLMQYMDEERKKHAPNSGSNKFE